MARYTYNAGLVTQALDKLYSACDSLDGTNIDMKKGIDMINNARGAENISVDFTPITGYQSSVIDYIETMAKEIKGKAQEIEEYQDAPWYKKLFATIGMGALKLVEGLASFVEQIGDGLVSIVGFIGGIFSSDFRDCIGEFVKKDWVGDTTAKWYEEGWLKSVNKYSIMSHESTAANVLKGIGVAAGYVVLSVCTAGAGTAVSLGVSAAAAAAGGIGSGTQAGLQAGKTFNQAFGQGVKQGAVAAATTLVVGGVANKLGALTKGGSAVLNSADEVTGALVNSSDEIANALVNSGDEVTNALVNSGDEVTNALVNSSDEVTTALANNADEVGNAVANSADEVGNAAANSADEVGNAIANSGDEVANAGKQTIGQKINAKVNSGIDKAKGLVNKGLEKAAQTKVGGAIGKGVNAIGTTATNATATVIGAAAGGNLSSPAESSAYRVAMNEAGNPSLGQQLAQESVESINNNIPTVNENPQQNGGGNNVEPTPTPGDGGDKKPSPTKVTPQPTTPKPTRVTPEPTTPRPTATTIKPNPTTPRPTSTTSKPNPTTPKPTITQRQDDIIRTLSPTNKPSYVNDTGSKSSGVLDTFGQVSGSLSDITGTSTSIPSSSSPILSSDSGSSKSMIPLGAGLGAAALAGLGAKAFLDKREKKEEDEEDLDMESWEEEPEVEIDYGIEVDDEPDYLSPTDEFAFQE